MQDILTEKEAKMRWCPMVRGHLMLNDGTNIEGINAVEGDGNDVRIGKCIASECMAWRLAHKPSASNEETGFCGAFGVPRHT